MTAVSDKIDIKLEGGKSKRVRSKDISLLHPGPVSALSELTELEECRRGLGAIAGHRDQPGGTGRADF